jgi:hypothetical protein
MATLVAAAYVQAPSLLGAVVVGGVVVLGGAASGAAVGGGVEGIDGGGLVLVDLAPPLLVADPAPVRAWCLGCEWMWLEHAASSGVIRAIEKMRLWRLRVQRFPFRCEGVKPPFCQ